MYHLIHSRFVWNWKKGERKRKQFVCVFPPNDSNSFSISSVWLLSHYRKAPQSLKGKTTGQKRRKLTCYKVFFQGKAILVIYTVNCVARPTISNIWNEQHIAVSVISPNTGSAWVNYWLNFRTNNISLRIHAIHSHFSPSCCITAVFRFQTDSVGILRWIIMTCTGT